MALSMAEISCFVSFVIKTPNRALLTQVIFPRSTLPSKMILPDESCLDSIGTTTGIVEQVCDMGATMVLGEDLLAESF